MSFNLEVDSRISFRGFRHRGNENPHGWGLAFYKNGSIQLFKEPINAEKSGLSDFVRRYKQVISKIFVGHVRYATTGSNGYRNTHPFYKVLNGKDYVFAHNGTLRDFELLDVGEFRPQGETDSEHAFCHLLNLINERNISGWKTDDFDWLAKKLHEINDLGKFNCLFSDGEYLFTYHDIHGHNGLYYVHRKPPYGLITLKDEDWMIDLSRMKSEEQTGYVIATRPLTDENWERYAPGELIVFKDGKIIYSSKKKIKTVKEKSLSPIDIEVLSVIRKSPHRMKLETIAAAMNYPLPKMRSIIRSLVLKGYLRQDSRDRVDWKHRKATYYTVPSKRKEIDELLK